MPQILQDEIFKGNERAGAKIFDLRFQTKILDTCNPCLHPLTVTRQQELVDRQTLLTLRFEIQQLDRSAEGWPYFLFVDNLQEQDIIPGEFESFQATFDPFGIEQVAQHNR